MKLDSARRAAFARLRRPEYSVAALRGACFGAGVTLIGIINGLFPALTTRPATPLAGGFVAVVTGALFGAVLGIIAAAALRGIRRARFRARFGRPAA